MEITCTNCDGESVQADTPNCYKCNGNGYIKDENPEDSDTNLDE